LSSNASNNEDIQSSKSEDLRDLKMRPLRKKGKWVQQNEQHKIETQPQDAYPDSRSTQG
jgi:hypothetical protein